MAHHPPHFDLYGHPLPSVSPPDTTTKIPGEWIHAPTVKTRTELISQRKQAYIPDISFDLDRDGVVGGQDLVLGKIFDVDKDGRLNQQERKQAEDAISNGFARTFVWGVEQAAPKRPFRIIQTRGVVVDAEDFTGVADTYHLDPKESPHARTVTELQEQRAEVRLRSLKQYREAWEQTRPPQKVPETKEYRLSDYPYKTWTEKRQAEIKAARVKNGLSPTCSDIDEKPSPSFTYVPNPKYRSRSHMQELRRRSQLQYFQETLSKKTLTPEQRVELREQEMVTLVEQGNPGKTYSEIQEKMRKEVLEHNKTTFAKVVVGIHGGELPKFAEERQEYWKLREGYRECPENESQIELQQKRKRDVPRDIYRVADKDTSPPPPDPFKATHIPRSKPRSPSCSESPNRKKVSFSIRNPADVLGTPVDTSNYRWTSLVHVFPKGDRPSLTPTRSTVSSHSPVSPVRVMTPSSQSRSYFSPSPASKQVTRNASSSLVRSSGFSTMT